MSKSGLTIRFPDGTMIFGRDAPDVLRRWRREQWHAPITAEEFRDELAKRAYMWSYTIINPRAKCARLLLELEFAGLIKIDRGEG